VSAKDQRFLRELIGEKSQQIAPGVDLGAFPALPREPREVPVILSVAMLREGRKGDGAFFLLAALERLRKEGYRFRWVHVGGGARLAELRARAEAAGIVAEFPGTQEDPRPFYARADIYAFPGFGEAWGMAYMEAQASRLPVVACAGAGVAEILSEGETGFLTPAGDEAAFAVKLALLLRDEPLRSRQGVAARLRMERLFDRRKNFARLWEEIEEAPGK
jgi:glycosyltransferase involved in cell wall biosynthesis